MERPVDTSLDLDRVEAEIQQRWFVWTAAGLIVQPVNRTGHGAPMSTESRPDSHSLSLRVGRPNAYADIVLAADGSYEADICRPDAETTIHEAAQVDSVKAFGEVVDRIVELITWSGVPGPKGDVAPMPPAQRSANWVLGHDGLP